jgi:hypothetical protein
MTTTPTAWTADLVRELFVVLYGGHRDEHGRWHPDTAEAARRRRVSVRTIQRWLHGNPDGAPSIPPARLEAIVHRRRPRARDIRREQLQLARQQKMLERAGLGRGRGNLRADYATSGWLDKHLVLILEDETKPLRRITVVRDDQATRTRAARGARIVDVAVAENKFLAERARYELLEQLGPYRLMLGTNKVPKGHTQVWLASAPLPTLPVHISE